MCKLTQGSFKKYATARGWGGIGFFVTNRYENFGGWGGLIFIQVRNAMNVFCRNILLFKRSISMEIKP